MKTERTTVNRLPERGRYDRETLYAILDEAPICTVAFVREGTPVAIPTIHARVDDQLYLHGSTASTMLSSLAAGAEACVTATILDGLVVARSVFHHSMNYRSAIVLGRARDVADDDEKRNAMRAVVEHVLAGRWAEARKPNRREIAATRIVAIPIAEASSKVRTGPPIDDEEDLALPIWAGVVPTRLTPSAPVPATKAIALPASVRNLV
ncbi:MAG: pyridoxamine 5'-phosphate oxidase family protein [Actinomycetota bacterium]|nr:pyridoxamine 5'-phosphate oxidase family protein [Actinomycetota bacterium]